MDPQKRAPDADAPLPKPTRAPDSETAEKAKDNERLDEELDETFPASDPIPFQHDD
jgi:hypothetical protein